MKNTVLKFGSAIGLVMGLMMVIIFSQAGDNPDMFIGQIIGYSLMTVVFTSMFFGLKSFRDKENNGELSFGKGIAIGLLISLTAVIFYSLVWTIYTEVTSFDFGQMYVEMQVKELEEKGAEQEEIDKLVAESQEFVEYYRNPLFRFAITTIEPLPVGIIMSLICALILKRSRSEIV